MRMRQIVEPREGAGPPKDANVGDLGWISEDLRAVEFLVNTQGKAHMRST
jgi:hypothetical protein